jgi:two-component system, LytTR family, sensor kinase
MKGFALRARWVWLGALGWLVVTVVYVTATGFRGVAAGVGFYRVPGWLASHVLMMLVGALLSPLLFVLFRRVRDRTAGRLRIVIRYALIGVAYLALWSAALVVLVAAGVMRGPPIAGYLEAWLQVMVMMAFIALGVYAVMVMMFEVVRYLEHARQRQVEAARLQAELAEAHTTELRARLNPDFVYESFGIASGLMEGNVRGARTVLADLGELLRVSLGRNGEGDIPLQDEIGLLDRYLDIQRHRLPGGVSIDLTVPDELMSARVPALILQPVVESLFPAASSRVGRLALHISASCTGGDLHVEVSTDTAGEEFGGDGLERARARLELVHGDGAELQVMRRRDGPVVRMRLPQLTGSVCHE